MEEGTKRTPAGLDKTLKIFSLNAADFGDLKNIKKGIAMSEKRNKYKINHRWCQLKLPPG